MSRFLLAVIAFGLIVPAVAWVKLRFFTDSSTASSVRSAFPKFIAYFEIMLAILAVAAWIIMDRYLL